MLKLKWTTESRRVNDLVPFEKNPRAINPKQLKDLTKSLKTFNLVEIPAIDMDNKILAGHQRLKVLQILGRGEEKIDASFVLSCANWMVAEFIRVYGNYSMDDAQKIVDKIAIPNYPVIFNIEGEEFITRNDLTVKQEILILLCGQKRDINFLFSKTKDDNRSRFNGTVASMVAKKCIALKDDFYHLLPNGIKEIQKKNLLNHL